MQTVMRILQVLASRPEASICLAILIFCTASLRAQPAQVDGADTAQSLQRADASLTEDKLRNKFNAFDYTDELPPHLGFGEFEQSLEQRFFGTYVFYSKLSDEGKRQVYEIYRHDRHISAIRSSTLELLH